MADIKASISNSNTSLTASINVDKKIVPVTLSSTETTLGQLGLSNVTNESKTTMFTNPAFTGIPTAPTADSPTNTTQIATTAFVQQLLGGISSGSLAGLTDTTITTIGDGEIIVYDNASSKYINKTLSEAGIADAATQSAQASSISTNTSNISTNTSNIALKAPINNPNFTGTVTGITPTMVGLGNVSNQSPEEIRAGITESHIPSGIARDTELSAHTSLTNNPHSVTKSQVGLGNVSNQSPEEIRAGITDSHIPSTITRDTELATHTGATNPHNITASTISLGNVENKSSATIRSEITESDIPSGITRDIELNAHVSATNPHNVTASQVGAYSTSEVDALVEGKDTLIELNDTSISSLTDNDIIAWDAAINKFSNQTLSEAGINAAGVGLGNVDNESKVSMFTNPAFTGIPTAPTANVNNSSGQIATTSFVSQKVQALLDGAPTSLDTLNEIAAALNDSPNQINAILTSLNGKVNTGDVYTNTQVDALLAAQNSIAEMTDVDLTAIGEFELLVYDSTSGKFKNRTRSEADISTATDLNNHIALSNPHNTTKADVGLDQVTNSSPKLLPISTATQTALDLKANIASPTFTGTITGNGSGLTNLNASNISSGTIANGRLPSAATNITSVGTLANLTIAGQVLLSNANGLEIQKGYFNSGGIRIKHNTSANNEFAIAYEGDLSGSGEGTKNFKLQLKKNGSQISVIKFKPDGNTFYDGGNFGVGKTSPTSKLHVSGSTTLENGVDMATGASNNYVGIGTSSADRKLVIDGNVNIIKGDNHIANTAVLRTRATDDTGTFIDFGGPVVVTHDLFKNSSVPGGFADNSNHFHTIQKIDRITAQGRSEVKNIERVEEQYYAIQSNNLRNDKAAFWNWHRITRAIGSTDLSLSNLVGWNVQADQDFNKTNANPNGRAQTEQVPFSQSQNTIFTFNSQANREAVLSLDDLIRVTVTTDFVGPFVAQTHFAKVTAVSGATATVVLYAGNYKTKDEVPISTDAGGTGTAQSALSDTTTFSIDKIGGIATADVNGQVTSSNIINIDNLSGTLNESMYVTGTGITGRVQVNEVLSATQIKVSTNVSIADDVSLSFRNDIELEATKTLTVIDEPTRATGLQKLVQFTSAAAHGLEVNDTLTIVTDGTGGFQAAEVAHVLTKDSSTQVTCVYGRVFEPASNLTLSTISGSSVVGVFKGTLDGIHRYTAGDQLMTFWSNNVGRYKGYQIGPGSQAEGNCIAIGKNTYNKDANTIKIGYENNMLNIDSAGIDVAGTLDTTGNATIGGTLGTSDDITITKSSGTGMLSVSGQASMLRLTETSTGNDTAHTITNAAGDLYINSEGHGTTYGNIYLTTQRSSDDNQKLAVLTLDGDNARIGINDTTPSYSLDVNGTLRATGAVTFDDDLNVDSGTLFVDDSTNKVQIGDTSTTKQKGKLTIVGSNASGTGLAITHNTSTTDFMEMYYKGTASGGPFIMSRSQTGGAEIVFFNNGDVNINGGYKGITDSQAAKTPDNVGIGVNASAATNGKPTNKLHVYESTATLAENNFANVAQAILRLQSDANTNAAAGDNLYLDGESIYGTSDISIATNASKDIKFLPAKTQAVIFKSDGKVGIKETSPETELHIAPVGSAAPEIFVDGGTSYGGLLTLGTNRTSGNAGTIVFLNEEGATAAKDEIAYIASDIVGSTATNRGGDLRFYTKADGVDAPAQRMTINSTGEVGIGKVAASGVELDVEGDIAASGNVTIAGDLTVQGTTNTVNSSNLNVSDNIIGLNRGLTGANLNDSGFIIERGSSGDNAAILWDESADKFVIGTTASAASSAGDLTITTGNLDATLTTASQPNITGVGTITSGTWQGTAIDATYIGNLPASKITSGTIDDDGIASSSVTQHSGDITSLGTLTSLTVSGDLTVDTNTLKVDSTNNRVGIGITAPVSTLHVKQDDSAVGSSVGITVENDGTGDATVQYLLTSLRRWVTGIDNSDSDKFKFAYSGNVGSDTALELDVSGNVVATGTLTSTSSVSRPVQSDETDTNPIRNIRRMTQSAYDAITPDANTLYIIE